MEHVEILKNKLDNHGNYLKPEKFNSIMFNEIMKSCTNQIIFLSNLFVAIWINKTTAA